MLSQRRAAGFTLVEVMVTVFVVAIGLLAAAGLQALSKKAAFDAVQRTTATVLAQDMLERIRANSLQVADYATKGQQLSAAPATAATCGTADGAACSAAELVDYDLNRWWESLDGASEKIAAGGSSTANGGGLRSPTGCIRSVGNRVDVVIAWRGMSAIQQAESTDTDDPTSDPCGEDPAVADYEKDDSSRQSFRRVLRLQAHIH